MSATFNVPSSETLHGLVDEEPDVLLAVSGAVVGTERNAAKLALDPLDSTDAMSPLPGW
jgi:hypothetical protein